ncbi:hypothetical protein BCR34DRAFT_607918 [Clohesyomyces aquaticus]|uniref:Uncharacterized protein n=1 Tax=Clohesyomyces aquaticus TaxID=1231657 RepID=A0A1Y1YC36_9PLEO|nr:hypothetical protein BCR34DRAFT_607918 [Clohesyomyces aquaticus]
MPTVLAKFDDCTSYGVTEEDEKMLVKAEIGRLVADASEPKAFLLPSEHLPEPTDESGFQTISDLADQLATNLGLIKQDNSELALKHCPSLAKAAIRQFLGSRKTLYTRYGQDGVTEGRPLTLEPPERNRDAYFVLVNYITSSIMARWASKLKLISYDPTTYAKASPQRDVNFIHTSREERKNNADLIFIVHQTVEESMLENADQEKTTEVNTFDTVTDLTRTTTKSGRLSPDRFEISVLIHKTGLEKTLTAISADNDGDITVSSSPTQVKSVFTALELLHHNTQKIQRQQQGTHIDTGISAETAWEWPESGENNPEGAENPNSLQVDNTTSLLSLLIPQALAPLRWGW